MVDEDRRITCDGCGAIVRKTLVETDDGASVTLACACHVFDRTEGYFLPFETDLPDKWVDVGVTDV